MTMILTIEVDKEGVMRLVNVMGADRIELPPYLKKNGANAAKNDAVVSQQTAPATAPSGHSGPVRLDPKDPDFQDKKKELKAKGYRWHGEQKAWYPPRGEPKPENSQKTHQENWWGTATKVGLLKDDPDFATKKAALKSAGFKWNKVISLWEIP